MSSFVGCAGTKQVEVRPQGRYDSYQWQRLPVRQVHRVRDLPPSLSPCLIRSCAGNLNGSLVLFDFQGLASKRPNNLLPHISSAPFSLCICPSRTVPHRILPITLVVIRASLVDSLSPKSISVFYNVSTVVYILFINLPLETATNGPLASLYCEIHHRLI